MVAALRAQRGLLLTNVQLPSRRSREVDGVLITPDAVLTIEAKGTGLAGLLSVQPNGPWRIGGTVADFPSGPNPTSQARQQAQISAGLLAEAGVRTPRIRAIVAIDGDVQLAGGFSRVIDDVAVTACAQLPAAVRRLETDADAAGTITAADARRIAGVLGIGEAELPDLDALIAAGFPASHRYGATSPTPSAEPPDTKTPAGEPPVRRIVAGVALLAVLAAGVLWWRHDTRDAAARSQLTAGYTRVAEQVAARCGTSAGAPTAMHITAQGDVSVREAVGRIDCPTSRLPAAKGKALLTELGYPHAAIDADGDVSSEGETVRVVLQRDAGDDAHLVIATTFRVCVRKAGCA